MIIRLNTVSWEKKMWAKVLSVGVIVLNTSLSWGSDAFAGAVFANHPSTGNHCVDYLKEFPQLAILPFNDKGELSKNSLQKMVKDRFLKSYDLSVDKDRVTFPQLEGTDGGKTLRAISNSSYIKTQLAGKGPFLKIVSLLKEQSLTVIVKSLLKTKMENVSPLKKIS